MARLDVADEPMPEIARDLVGGIAAQALEPERQQVLHHAKAIAIQPFRVARVLVIELGQVLPDDFLAIVLAGGVCDPAIRLPDKPFRVLARQPGINGGVVDDEVDHHLQAAGLGGCRHLPDLIFRRCGALRIQQGRVDPEIIGNRIKAARGAQLLNGIDEHPVEAHRRRPGEMTAPAGKRPSKEGK